MARIKCKYFDCAFLDDGYCSAALIELDSDKGCLTYSPNAEEETEEGWNDSEQLEGWEEPEDSEGTEEEEDDDDPWMDDEEEEEY